MGLSFTIALGLRQRSQSQVRVPLSQIRDSPNLGGQVPVFISLEEQGGPAISPGTGFPFRRLLGLAGLRWRYSAPPPHGCLTASLLQSVLLITTRHGPHRKHRSSIVAYMSVAAETCLPNRCLETGCIAQFFYCCVRVCCGRYLATAATYTVTAYQRVYTPQCHYARDNNITYQLRYVLRYSRVLH
jgi:hypothetical protein